ncbi:MAG: alginate lyase family protein [Bryobacteraceae bacterium]
MRSAEEIRFRLWQEAANLLLFAIPPRLPAHALEYMPMALPAVEPVIERLRGTRFALDVQGLAAGMLEGNLPLLGFEIRMAHPIHWRRDPINGVETGTNYFRRIPYLDFAQAGDHKNIWEFSRHQHLVLMAQASRFTGDKRLAAEIAAQLESWLAANPFARGINWTSALEVAFRALSWIWIYHLIGAQMDAGLRRRFLNALYGHGCYLANNLSIYFSPNTHLLGEAVALHALGLLFPDWPRADYWRNRGRNVTTECLAAQVRGDGSHFEQSSYYHAYALDFFLFHQAIGGGRAPAVLNKMADYLAALMGPSRRLPLIGDDDGGRLFHPYGPRENFGRATLATCATMLGSAVPFCEEDLHEQACWWLGALVLENAASAAPAGGESRIFPDAGVAVMRSGAAHIVVDAGPFGEGSGGHSHSDALHLVADYEGEEVLADGGTYTYVADAQWRNWFRGSAAHNTIRVDGEDQAVAAGAFRWAQPPVVSVSNWTSSSEWDDLCALCRYRGFTHRRRILFMKPSLVLILDELDGSAGDHQIEQFWHPGGPAAAIGEHAFRIGTKAVLLTEPGLRATCASGGEHGWSSRSFGEKHASTVIQVLRHGGLPARLRTIVDFSGKAVAEEFESLWTL